MCLIGLYLFRDYLLLPHPDFLMDPAAGALCGIQPRGSRRWNKRLLPPSWMGLAGVRVEQPAIYQTATVALSSIEMIYKMR